MERINHFVDTSALLERPDYFFFTLEEKFAICDISLVELENIKTSATRDESIKQKARYVGHLLLIYPDKYNIIYLDIDYFKDQYRDFNTLKDNNDSKIIFTALYSNAKFFYTNDTYCALIANSVNIFDQVIVTEDPPDNYKGYIELHLSDEELANFYSTELKDNLNSYHLLENQYLVLFNNSKEVIDKYVWRGGAYQMLKHIDFKTEAFGKIAAYNDDIYQQLALDSMFHNKLTVMRGKAGSGKSYLALGYLFYLLEKNEISKIIIFTNTVATADSARLGFYPGTRDEKLLDSQIGNFLSSKLGDITQVERLIEEGKLVLVPMSDCRGMDTTGQAAGIYLTEAQNATKDMMKLLLQRIGEDSICIIEGDDKTQTDMEVYKGKNNGLKRLSEVFRGEDYYGEIELQNCHRGKIAARAELF